MICINNTVLKDVKEKKKRSKWYSIIENGIKEINQDGTEHDRKYLVTLPLPKHILESSTNNQSATSPTSTSVSVPENIPAPIRHFQVKSPSNPEMVASSRQSQETTKMKLNRIPRKQTQLKSTTKNLRNYSKPATINHELEARLKPDVTNQGSNGVRRNSQGLDSDNWTNSKRMKIARGKKIKAEFIKLTDFNPIENLKIKSKSKKIKLNHFENQQERAKLILYINNLYNINYNYRTDWFLSSIEGDWETCSQTE